MFPPVNARVPKRLWGCSYKAVVEGSTPSSSTPGLITNTAFNPEDNTG